MVLGHHLFQRPIEQRLQPHGGLVKVAVLSLGHRSPLLALLGTNADHHGYGLAGLLADPLDLQLERFELQLRRAPAPTV